MAGRKPKPTALKKLEGNPGKRKLNTKEPMPGKGMSQRESRTKRPELPTPAKSRISHSILLYLQIQEPAGLRRWEFP